jgi:hypothetical protein
MLKAYALAIVKTFYTLIWEPTIPKICQVTKPAMYENLCLMHLPPLKWSFGLLFHDLLHFEMI